MTTDHILGCVLAGGRSERMGRDKALVRLGEQSLVERAVARLSPQVGRIAVSYNGDPAALGIGGIPVLPDTLTGFQGPLAGILAALAHARGFDGVTHVATVAADTPFFPETLVSALARSAPVGAPVLAASGERDHPVFGLFPVSLAGDLEDWLRTGESRSVRAWTDRHATLIAAFPFDGPHDPFFNINTEADLLAAHERLGQPRATPARR